MNEQPQVIANTEVRLVKEKLQPQFGHCSREQAQLIIDAASLLGAHTARDFVTAMITAINCEITDEEFRWATRVILDEFGSEDLWPAIFEKNNKE